MKTIKKIAGNMLLAIGVFVTTTAHTQPAALRSRIDSVNILLSTACSGKNAETLIQFYAQDAVCMPEYHHTLRGNMYIQQYFQQWFDATKLNELSCTIYEVQQIGDHAIETGTFLHRFFKTNGDSLTYNGKYIRCWKLNKKGKLLIVSEIWGGNDYTDRMSFPAIKVTAPVQEPAIITSTLAKELKARNAYITKLVKERKGDRTCLSIYR